MDTEKNSSPFYKDIFQKDVDIDFLLWASLISLGFGLYLPIMTLKKFILLNETVSIYSGLVSLLHQGEYILFLVVFIFSVIFPISKLTLLFLSRYSKAIKMGKILPLLEILSKWSMLDVFIVALLVIAVKSNFIIRIKVHTGIYIFAVSIILSMIASYRLGHTRIENTMKSN